MTGIERLRAQVEGGTTANVVLPRALLRDVLRQIEEEESSRECTMRFEGGGGTRAPRLRCSRCHGVKFGYQKPAYCPHCGARVRGAGEGESLGKE